MNKDARPESGWRGSREVWLEAAHEVLIAEGAIPGKK